MELKNPIHVHPLILKEVHNDKVKKVICYGCREPILDTTYSCKECENYFLHRRCAELPSENKDPRHPEHSLILFERSTRKNHSTYMCDVCRERQVRFTYYCSDCHFNICVLCVFEKCEITHPCHGHPLTLLRRSAKFNCNACKLSGKGSSYLCYTCQFWIHKSCVLSPTTIELDYGHHHPLNLSYKHVSSKFSNYKDRCNRCGKEITNGSWAYRCKDQCKYFVHFKCAISTSIGGGGNDGAEMEENGKDDLDLNLIRLPVAGDSVDLVRYFVEHSNQEETKGETTIGHCSRDHQLILVDKHHKNETKGDQKICNGCVQPISPPYYICEICNYFLHISCANLPKTLRLPWHPNHPKHQIQRSQYPEFYNLFKCEACKSFSNGFYYKCETCEFYLDVKCAFLPLKITHDAHEHPMVETECVTHKCHACHSRSWRMRFRCDSCKFNLSYKCALLPRTIRHRWDEHPLNLFYTTITDHPDEFYCEYCEEEINPQCWLYHCGKCDQSFHLSCVLNDYSNTKFGGILEVDEHPHPLMFVQKAKRMSTCCRCGKAFKDCPSFDCQVCYDAVCQECLDKLHVKNSKGWGK